MKISPLTTTLPSQVELRPEPRAGWQLWQLEEVRTHLDAALTGVALLDTPDVAATLEPPVVWTAVRSHAVAADDHLRTMLLHDGPADALAAAREVAPGVSSVARRLTTMGFDAPRPDVDRLKVDFSTALDRIELTLGDAGWS